TNGQEPRQDEQGRGQKGQQPGHFGPTAGPFDQPSHGGYASGCDRLPLEETLKIVGQLGRGGVTLITGFFQAFQADRFQVAWDGRLLSAWSGWRVRDHA